MSHPNFIPISLIREDPAKPETAIPESEWNDADRAALRTVHELYADIDGFRAGYDRSKQRSIGPSELGLECNKCFMRKMGEVPKSVHDDGSWKTQVGTYVHAGLEQDFERRFGDAGTRMAEGELTIDTYKDRTLRGHCDMFVPNIVDGRPAEEAFGIVVDWKIPSTSTDPRTGKLKPSTTMAKVVSGKIGQQYLAQSMAYARGWVLKGYNITHVVIYYIPSFGELWDARPIIMRYSPEWAAWGIARWRAALDARDVFMAFGETEEKAWEKIIAVQDKAKFCFSCKHYDEIEETGGLSILSQGR